MKTEITSILVACDFSSDANHAARLAAALAREHVAELKLMTVVRRTALDHLRKGRSEAPQRLLEAAGLDLDALAAQLKTIAGASSTVVRSGDVESEILAEADHADVLVIGARGLSRTRDLFLGTTTERLVGKSRRPMIVVKREPRDGIRRLFVAVDFSMPSWSALEFAARIAPHAELHVFHALEGPTRDELRRSGVPPGAMEALMAQERQQALANVQNMVEKCRLPTDRTTVSVVVGNPRQLVYETAAAWNADAVVVGKQGHGGVGDFLVGGVTRYTMLFAQCAVIVVPDYPRV